MSYFTDFQLQEMRDVINVVVGASLETFSAHRAAIDLTFQELQTTRVAADATFKNLNARADTFNAAVGNAVTQLTEQQKKITEQMDEQNGYKGARRARSSDP